MKVLFFDDMETRHKLFKKNLIGTPHDVTYVYNVKDAIKAINDQKFDLMYLDHDMDGETYQPPSETTGWAVAQHIAKLPQERRPIGVIVHSYNLSAAELMHDHLVEAGVRAVRRLFDTGGMDFWHELRQPK